MNLHKVKKLSLVPYKLPHRHHQHYHLLLHPRNLMEQHRMGLRNTEMNVNYSMPTVTLDTKAVWELKATRQQKHVVTQACSPSSPEAEAEAEELTQLQDQSGSHIKLQMKLYSEILSRKVKIKIAYAARMTF